MGFVASDYATLIWGLEPVRDPETLLDPAGLREGLEGWLAQNAVMKRAFRNVATVAGLIQRQLPGQRKSGRQATFSTDILYDTLARHDPDHLLLRVTREEAMRGLIDFARLEEMASRTQGRIDLIRLDQLPPLCAPLLLEQGRVPVQGAGRERLLAEEAARLLRLAGWEGAV